MNNRELRPTLLYLLGRLTNYDRQRLHFYLKNHVPRDIGDDSTLNGSLKLLDSLFDQAKISEQNITFLINALKQIQRFDIVLVLEAYEREILRTDSNPSIENIESTITQLINDDDNDGSSTINSPITQINYTGNNNNNSFIDSNNVNINPIQFDLDSESRSTPPNRSLCTCLHKNKCLILMSLLTLGILITFLVLKNVNNNHLKDDIKEKDGIISKIRLENNLTLEKNNVILSEKMNKIQQLTKQIVESKKEQNTTLIKIGRKFGDSTGDYFDDSLISNFTISHYLSGLITSTDKDYLDACQFIYKSSLDNQTRIESNIHGDFGQKFNSILRFDLDHNERIYRIQVKTIKRKFIMDNNNSFTMEIIKDLKFFTNKGRSIPSNNILLGDVYTEQFDGYTLGYATGRTSRYIDQLQFFLYRTI